MSVRASLYCVLCVWCQQRMDGSLVFFFLIVCLRLFSSFLFSPHRRRPRGRTKPLLRVSTTTTTATTPSLSSIQLRLVFTMGASFSVWWWLVVPPLSLDRLPRSMDPAYLSFMVSHPCHTLHLTLSGKRRRGTCVDATRFIESSFTLGSCAVGKKTERVVILSPSIPRPFRAAQPTVVKAVTSYVLRTLYNFDDDTDSRP